jgi:hypothetical protein
LLRRYRDLRAIGTRHTAPLAHSLLDRASWSMRNVSGQTLIVDSEVELTLVFDFAIYNAKDGRSRAIDRYAKSRNCRPDSDEKPKL